MERMPVPCMDAETRSTEFYVKVVGWVYARRKPLLIGVIVAAVIGLVVAFLAWKAKSDEESARALFFAVPIESGARAAPPCAVGVSGRGAGLCRHGGRGARAIAGG